MRRRRPVLSSSAADAPARLRVLRLEDWPGVLLCEGDDGRCLTNGAEHMDTCALLSARRRWFEARREYLAAGGVLA